MKNEGPNHSIEKELQEYLAMLRALQIYYQSAHWISKGEPYYADHLLYARLYESSTEQIDSLGEKLVGMCGDNLVCAKTLSEMTSDILSSTDHMTEDTLGFELASTALKIEEKFVEMTKEVYDLLENEELLTLGFDDMLMSLSNEHESNLYLLGQRVKGS